MYKNSNASIKNALKNSIVECAPYNPEIHGLPTGTSIRKKEYAHIVGTDKDFILWISPQVTTVSGVLNSDFINATAYEFDIRFGNIKL